MRCSIQPALKYILYTLLTLFTYITEWVGRDRNLNSKRRRIHPSYSILHHPANSRLPTTSTREKGGNCTELVVSNCYPIPKHSHVSFYFRGHHSLINIHSKCCHITCTISTLSAMNISGKVLRYVFESHLMYIHTKQQTQNNEDMSKNVRFREFDRRVDLVSSVGRASLCV